MAPEKTSGARQPEWRFVSAGDDACGDFGLAAADAPMAPPTAPMLPNSSGISVSAIATNPRSSPISHPASADPAGCGQVGSFAQAVWTSVVAKALSTATMDPAMSTAATSPHQKPASAPSRARPVARAPSSPASSARPRRASKLRGRSGANAGSQSTTKFTTSQTPPKTSPQNDPGRQALADLTLWDPTHR